MQRRRGWCRGWGRVAQESSGCALRPRARGAPRQGLDALVFPPEHENPGEMPTRATLLALKFGFKAVLTYPRGWEKEQALCQWPSSSFYVQAECGKERTADTQEPPERRGLCHGQAPLHPPTPQAWSSGPWSFAGARTLLRRAGRTWEPGSLASCSERGDSSGGQSRRVPMPLLHQTQELGANGRAGIHPRHTGGTHQLWLPIPL